jgi:hypothetical protein
VSLLERICECQRLSIRLLLVTLFLVPKMLSLSPLNLLPWNFSYISFHSMRPRAYNALQDIKDMMRKVGEVTYADLSRNQDNQGYVWKSILCLVTTMLVDL